ncbi:hypothetical protein KI387_035650 [Taxus chinensis]|uniref:Uncharacterized protein n=1 Tax=Taxus chinensis TaxID=29808 RepID=A0AA38FPN3_TAXCH|nr:hypothetical protein KI387_035650 [Taxus chinensis]
MDVKMGCLQAETGSPALRFLQAGGAYKTSVLKKNSVRPCLGNRVGGLAEKCQGKGRRSLQWKVKSMAADDNGQKNQKEADELGASSFCIIEGPETLRSFATMQLQEIQDNIRSRRNKIFLLMEEVRRLRVQQRIRIAEMNSAGDEIENEMPDIPSSIPFLPHMTPAALRKLYATCFSFIAGIIMFGGLIAPSLELKLGLGGTSYEDFIRNMHLPMQLSQVDPIVASFSGGAVGVISALMVVEANNVEQQMHKRCRYCHGTGMYQYNIFCKCCCVVDAE